MNATNENEKESPVKYKEKTENLWHSDDTVTDGRYGLYSVKDPELFPAKEIVTN